MSAFKFDTFGGMVPAVDDLLLPDKAAAHSENTWLYSGRLSGFRSPKFVRAVSAGTAKVFRIPNNFVDYAHIADSVWMEFENGDTDVQRGLVIGDTFDRYYWASSSAPPKYNTRQRITDGDPEWLLGLPTPDVPALVVTGGSATNETRSYLLTWVTEYGEESAAGIPVVVTGHPDGSWDLTFTAADPDDMGVNRNITKTRIYRTITSTAGVASFFLVDEIDADETTYSDTKTDTEVSSNSELESTNWTAPPDDLQGFIVMPNGILAGFRENEVWFCEPYRPHAWPALYTIVVDFPIVGLGVIGQSLIVCTQGPPVMVSGIHPATMAQSKSASVEPCLSRGSILSTSDGVYYASPNGLIFVSGAGVVNVTRQMITKDKWQAFVSVPTLRCAALGTGYFAFGSSRQGVFDDDGFDTDDAAAFATEDFTGSHCGVLIEPTDARVAFNILSDREVVDGVQNDVWSGAIFIIKNGNLYQIDTADTVPVPRVYLWRSKVFEVAKVLNLGVMRVRWRLPPGDAPVASGADIPNNPLGGEFPELPPGVIGYARAYADGVQVWEREMLTSGELMRLPSGFKAEFWQFEIQSYVDILSVQIATTAKALASV